MDALTGKRAHLKPVVILAIHTGMRRGELLSLMWQNVGFARSLIYVTNTKTGHDREIPMNAKVREALSDVQQVNGEYEFVFTNPKTGAKLVELKDGFQGRL